MRVLIAKLGAAGDVVRTTPLVRRLEGEVTWLTDAAHLELLQGVAGNLCGVAWEERHRLTGDPYGIVINLEESVEVAAFLRSLRHDRWFGVHADGQGRLGYTGDSRGWFELSLISAEGRARADALKLRNRRSYQEILFEGLGYRFEGEPYLLPEPIATPLRGDVAVAVEAGLMWPMKRWAFGAQLRQRLEASGLTVNVLPRRARLREHLGDVQAHRCLVGGDSLPMHLALGSGIRCVTLFTCTSPWEIYDYGLQTKILSPRLEQYFYRRDYDESATTAIGVEPVLAAVRAQLERAR